MLRLTNLIALLALAGSCTLPVRGQQTRRWTDAERTFMVQELEQTRRQLVNEVASLTPEQVNFREAPGRWSVLEIVEHLEVQDEMYWRELDILPRGPQMPDLAAQVRGNDEKLFAYEHDPGKTDAGYLKPVGRFGTKALALQAFDTVRSRIIRFVSTTPKDLRGYVTFRSYPTDGKLADASIYAVRDLHQLMLTCIAHTKRHLGQLQRVKAHPDFPRTDPYRLDGQPVHAAAGEYIYHPPSKMHRMVNKGKDPLRVVYFWWKPGGDPRAFEGYRFLEAMPKAR